MSKFRDLSKVGLALVLCCAFTGIGNAITCAEAEDHCKVVTARCEIGLEVEKEHKERESHDLFYFIDPVERNNNNIKTNYYCGIKYTICNATLTVCNEESRKRISDGVAGYKSKIAPVRRDVMRRATATYIIDTVAENRHTGGATE